MSTYPDGWATPPRQLTIDEITARHAKSNPEFLRRVMAMMVDCPTSLGIGESSRSSAQQEAVFRQRYVAYTSPPGIQWDGAWWRKKPGVASAAPPGSSYHEDDVPGGSLAVDMIGDLKWMKAACASYGLREFSEVNSEPWHVQPAELPTGRSRWDGTPIAYFPLPGDTPPPPPPPPPQPQGDIDMLMLDYTNPKTGQWTALTFTGTHLAHTEGHADEVIRTLDVPRRPINDVQLDAFIESAATTTDPPPEFSAGRKAAWTAARA